LLNLLLVILVERFVMKSLRTISYIALVVVTLAATYMVAQM